MDTLSSLQPGWAYWMLPLMTRFVPPGQAGSAAGTLAEDAWPPSADGLVERRGRIWLFVSLLRFCP
jgi:hypothetical protein